MKPTTFCLAVTTITASDNPTSQTKYFHFMNEYEAAIAYYQKMQYYARNIVYLTQVNLNLTGTDDKTNEAFIYKTIISAIPTKLK
jgi:hypothetical protein